MQLSEWISKELGHHLHHEPETGYVGGFDIVVKCLVSSVVERNMLNHNGFDPNKWDKIITLKRNDTRKAAESMTIAESNQNWHGHYNLTDNWIKQNESKIQENEIFISRGNEVIDRIDFPALKLTYEGIYQTGEEIPMLKDYLGITNPQYLDMLDKRNKYRRDFI